ncbi:MAG: hypothetical protein CG439_1451 [Methylococcaceae bacterium NSP1-2]|nr:hypothetical protein [Methylococcaceae bacterium]OYV18021.1 MAG: hypothetical protein CG439_1451 [Methylococcaceae bacterium NSP1-2]
MQTLFYCLIILSSLLGLIVGGLGCVLGFMMKSSYINTDQVWGWAIIACSLIYLIHPALVYWLYKTGHSTLAMVITAFFILSGGVLVVLLPSAIEAGARP